MLAIRMQRTGRKGHAMFRVIVQDSRRTPTSGKVVAQLGSYDPHAKTVTLNKEKAAFYLEHGAQPSDRAIRLLKAEGVKLPDWVTVPTEHSRTVRNADKRRSTRPAEPEAESPTEAPAETPEAEVAPTTETDAEPESTETPVAETAPADAAEAADDTEAADTKTETTAETSEDKPE
jgi:small subunit ribosomal protein S16